LLMAKLHPKPLYFSTLHYSNCDLNVKNLVGKCIVRLNIYYTFKTC
jgi:hypothetical protein